MDLMDLIDVLMGFAIWGIIYLIWDTWKGDGT